jgi:AcrR family transcriptional regulator
MRPSSGSEPSGLRASRSSASSGLRASGSSADGGNGAEPSRREELLTVATKLFAARGYHGTRINDVADVVGLNKATVYHYYASKSLILFDIYREAADRTVAAVHDEPSWSAREAIFHFTRRLLENIANNIDGAAVYFQESPYITEWFTEEQVAYIRTAEAAVYEHVRDVIDRGIASGEFYECDSHVLALGYIGMTLGAYRWLRPTGRRSAEEIAIEFSTALLRGLIRDPSVREDSPFGVPLGAVPAPEPRP